jgi:hypothetical protein
MAILSLAGSEKEPRLPAFFIPPESQEQSEISGARSAVDLVWQRYFLHAKKVALGRNSRFLASWVGFEVGLRNALAAARAEALDLDPAAYRISPELGDPDISYDQALDDWSSRSNPLEALEGLDRARWNWLSGQEPWYSFSDDEVACYTAKLLLLHRWRRIFEKRPSEGSV